MMDDWERQRMWEHTRLDAYCGMLAFLALALLTTLTAAYDGDTLPLENRQLLLGIAAACLVLARLSAMTRQVAIRKLTVLRGRYHH